MVLRNGNIFNTNIEELLKNNSSHAATSFIIFSKFAFCSMNGVFYNVIKNSF